jgi:hypothetical protein
VDPVEENLPIVRDSQLEAEHFHEVTTVDGQSFKIPLVHSPTLAQTFSTGDGALLTGLIGNMLIVGTAVCRMSLHCAIYHNLPGRPPFKVQATREKTKAIVKDLEALIKSSGGSPNRGKVFDAHTNMTEYLRGLDEMPQQASRHAAFRKQWKGAWPFHRSALSYAISKLLSDNLSLPQIRVAERLMEFQRCYFRVGITSPAVRRQIERIGSDGSKAGFMIDSLTNLASARWVRLYPKVDQLEAEVFLKTVRTVLIPGKICW